MADPYADAPAPFRDRQNQINYAFNTAQERLNAQKGDTMRQYGLTADGQVDPSNPYGAASMQARDQGSQLLGAQAQARGGHIGGGLAAQRQSAMRFQFGAQKSQLADQFNQTLRGYNWQGQDAQNTYNVDSNKLSTGYGDYQNQIKLQQLQQQSPWWLSLGGG